MEGEVPGCCHDNYSECAEIFQTVNNWFDVVNSKTKYNGNPLKCAYGINLDLQNETLNKMTDLMTKVRVGYHKNLLPFQQGVIVTNKSLQQLFLYLKEKYSSERFDLSYILTNTLNPVADYNVRQGTPWRKGGPY